MSVGGGRGIWLGRLGRLGRPLRFPSGYPGGAPATSATLYERWLLIKVVPGPAYRARQDTPPVWVGEARSVGASSDLRMVLNYLLVADFKEVFFFFSHPVSDISGRFWSRTGSCPMKAARLAGRLAHAYLFLGPSGVASHHRPGLGRGPELRTTGGRWRRLRHLPLLPPPAGGRPSRLSDDLPGGAEDPDRDRAIRELRRLTAYPPLGGGWRVVVIKPAEALTVQNDAAAKPC